MFTDPRKPVVGVTWDEAVTYCRWLSMREGQQYRLPTEAECEYAMRGGRDGVLFPWGDEPPATLNLIGCDAENAGDAVDILRAATLFVGLARDAASDPFSLTAHDALALATIRGAEAINKADIIGSLEPGKQADIVVHSTAGPQFLPRSTDPVLQLIWASDGRSVSEVLIAGRLVVTGGQCRTVELDDLREQARACRDRLLATRV